MTLTAADAASAASLAASDKFDGAVAVGFAAHKHFFELMHHFHHTCVIGHMF